MMMHDIDKKNNHNVSDVNRIRHLVQVALNLSNREWTSITTTTKEEEQQASHHHEGDDVNDLASSSSSSMMYEVHLTALLFVRILPILVYHHHKHHRDDLNNEKASTLCFGFSNLSTTTICQECLQILLQLDDDKEQEEESEPPQLSSSPLCSFFYALMKVDNTSIFANVLKQLQDYVQTILSYYYKQQHQLPFHNAQHAHHRILSANKLMDIMLLQSSSSSSFDNNDKKNKNAVNDAIANDAIATTTTVFGLQYDPLALFSLLFAAMIQHVDFPCRHNANDNNHDNDENNYDHLHALYHGESVAEHHALYVAFTELLTLQKSPLTSASSVSSGFLLLPPLSSSHDNDNMMVTMEHRSYYHDYKYGDLLSVLFPPVHHAASYPDNKDSMMIHSSSSSLLFSSSSWQAFHRLVVSMVLSTDLSSPQQTQLTLSKWNQAALFSTTTKSAKSSSSKNKTKTRKTSTSSGKRKSTNKNNDNNGHDFLSLLETLCEANKKKKKKESKKNKSKKTTRSSFNRNNNKDDDSVKNKSKTSTANALQQHSNISSKKSKSKSQSISRSSSSSSGSSSKNKKTINGDNDNKEQTPNRETVSIQQNNVNDNRDEDKNDIADDNNDIMSVLVANRETTNVMFSMNDDDDVVDEDDDGQDVNGNREDDDEFNNDDDSSSSSSSSSSMSSSSSDMCFGSVTEGSWKEIYNDDGDYDDDDADDESYVEQVFKEEKENNHDRDSKEESPWKSGRGWSSDSALISSMRTCPSLLEDDNDDDSTTGIFRQRTPFTTLHGMTLSSPISLPKTTTTTPTRAILTATTTTTTTGSLSPLTAITAAMTESPSSPHMTPAVSPSCVPEENPTKKASGSSGTKVRPSQSRSPPRRSKSLAIKSTTASLSLCTEALTSKMNTSTLPTSSAVGRKKSNSSNKKTKHVLNPRSPILSKYTKQRLGIQRSMDLSGQLIETYPAPIISTGTPSRKQGRQQRQDSFKAAVVLETILAAANAADYLQGWEPMVYWSQRLFQEMHGHGHTSSGRNATITASKWFVNQIAFMEVQVLPLAYKLEAVGVFSSLNKSFFSKIVKDCRDQWLLDGENVTAKMFANNQQPTKHHDCAEQEQRETWAPGDGTRAVATPTSDNRHWNNIGYTTTTNSPTSKPRDLAAPTEDLKAKWCDVESIFAELNKSPRISGKAVLKVDEPDIGTAIVLAKTKAELVEAQNQASKYHQQLLAERSRSAAAQESYDEELTRILFSHEEVCGQLREELESSRHQLHVLQAQHHSSVSVVSCVPGSLEQRINSHDDNTNKATKQLERRVHELQGQLGRLGAQLETAESRVKMLEEELASSRKSQRENATHPRGEESGIANNNNSSSINESNRREKKLTGSLQSKEIDSSKIRRISIVSSLFFMAGFVCFSVLIFMWMEATTLDRKAFPIYRSTDDSTTGSMPKWAKDKFALVTEKIPAWVKDNVAAALQHRGRGH